MQNSTKIFVFKKFENNCVNKDISLIIYDLQFE